MDSVLQSKLCLLASFFPPAVKWISFAWDWLTHMCYWPPATCFQKPQSHSWTIAQPHHSLSLAIFIPPPPCSLFPNLFSFASSTSSLPLSSCYSHCPPTCLPVLVHPPLSASVNVFCPYKERAQADCTNRVSSAGVLQGQEDHSNCNGRLRQEEDGGEWMEGWGGGCRATTLLSMAPNKTTEIGTEEEEVGRGSRGWWGEAGGCISV